MKREVLRGRVGVGKENGPSFSPWAWLLLNFYPFVMPMAAGLVSAGSPSIGFGWLFDMG